VAQNCLYIGTVLPFRRKSISVILGTVKTLHSSRSGLERLLSISVKVVVSISISKSPESAEQRAGRDQLFQYDTAAFIKLEQIIFSATLDRRHQICRKSKPSHSEPHMAKVTCFSAVLNGKTKYRRIRQ
jgi:hypothetical protein